MAKAMTTTEPAGHDLALTYPVLVPGSEAAELVRANTAGEAISVGDLERIKVPAGGGTMWMVPTLEGEQPVKAIEGIIMHVARRRAYWSNPNPTGDPPDCSSKDCVTGVGNPGGVCEVCPLHEYGSKVKPGGEAGRSQACTENSLLFMLLPGNNLPVVVKVPPGSLKVVKGYRLKLKVPYFACVTRLELSKQQNKDGIAYAQIAPTFVNALDGGAVASVRQYAERLKGVFESVTVDRDSDE